MKRRKSFDGHCVRVGSVHVVPAADRMCGLALVFAVVVAEVFGGNGGC